MAKSNALSTEADLGAALMAGEVNADDTAKMVVSMAIVVLYMVPLFVLKSEESDDSCKQSGG